MDKVFVFGGKNPDILKEIQKLEIQFPQYKGRIVPLGMQDDIHIAPLMTRSNVVVTRGGGLSVMEQLAMNHMPGQVVFIHHKDLPQGSPENAELTSGISWEDANVEALIDKMVDVGVTAEKTSPARVGAQLAAIFKPRAEFDLKNKFATQKTGGVASAPVTASVVPNSMFHHATPPTPPSVLLKSNDLLDAIKRPEDDFGPNDSDDDVTIVIPNSP